jgi:uncharacterized protein YcfJ
MRTFIFALCAAAVTIPVSMAAPTTQAEAKRHHYRGHSYQRGCRYSSGTTGLVAGGVGGALVGNSVLGHGALGTIAGGVGGAFAGRAIDRTITAKKRCR